jgi:hypothetical protein
MDGSGGTNGFLRMLPSSDTMDDDGNQQQQQYGGNGGNGGGGPSGDEIMSIEKEGKDYYCQRCVNHKEVGGSSL